MELSKDNPIIDTGLELVVSYAFPSDAIVGILYSSLLQDDENVRLQKLPVSNIPDEIRRMDPNLKDKPTHQLTCKDGFCADRGEYSVHRWCYAIYFMGYI